VSRRAAPERPDPDAWTALREQSVAHALWLDRAVVMLFAALTGLAVVGFTLLANAASYAHKQLRSAPPLGSWAPWFMLVWTPLLTVALLAWTRRFAPGALGSGIPQEVRAVDDDLTPAQRRALVSGGLLAGVVAVAVFGNQSHFGRLRVPSLSWVLLVPGLVVALVCGLAAVLPLRAPAADAWRRSARHGRSRPVRLLD
jgi:H+/Cl- antiporter ClcA